MKSTGVTLSQEVVGQLQGEKLLFIISSNTSGETYTTAISWLAAVNESLIRFAISPKSPLLANIKELPEVEIIVIIPGNVLSVRGTAKVNEELITDLPFPMSCVEVEVSRVDDIMFYGGLVTEEPRYEKTYPADLSKKLDTAIYRSLREPI
ncbi:pyridoxamine 5'-phosphate oxidase family protein [Ammoniphilus sp. 3BR4]|uniref:pyridoxamine 5'-phosphate oxidase family protein n=1 Tax=Ammoniphilus sp. 3BR4 TaxID=3158265 RepID=UPI00346702DB